MRFDNLAQLRSSGRNQRWFVISAIIHVVFIIGLILVVRPFRPARTVTYIDLGREESMPAYQPQGGGRPTGTPGARPKPAPALPNVTSGAPTQLPSTSEAATPQNGEQDSLPSDTHRELGPEYGDGRLWVKAGDAEGRRLPARAAVDSLPVHVARVDSALAAKIRSYLDTVPPDSFATRPAPKWTTQIAGKTWGLDGKYIYLAGVKIPTAVLALLPLPASAGGNYDQQQHEAKTDAMRRDIIEAGERAANAVEFNKYVKEVRARKEMEHRAHEAPNQPPAASDTTKNAAPLFP